MAKKRKRTLVQNKDVNNKEFSQRVAQLLNESDEIPVDDGLVDVDYMFQPSRMAEVIRRRFEQKETPEDIAHYTSDVLTDVLSHLRVPGRSNATTKIDKAELLQKFMLKRNKFDKERTQYRKDHPIVRERPKKKKQVETESSPVWTKPRSDD